MINASPLRFCFAILVTATLAAAPHGVRAADATADAINEAVRRQAETISLRQKLAEAQAVEARKDLTGAATLYQDAYARVQQIGAGIDKETAETLDGLTRVRLALAREASRMGDLKEADTQVKIVLTVNPKSVEAQEFKHANDKALAEAYPRMANDEVLAQVPLVHKDQVQAAKLVQDARVLLELGKLEEAEAKLKQSLAMDPENRAASYYMDLIKEGRYGQAVRKREANSKNALVLVEQAWDVSKNKDRLPVPNPYARTNLTFVGKGRQTIMSKLDRIKLDSVLYDGLPLSEVIRNLYEEAKKRDPDKRGINFIVNPNAEVSSQLFPQQVLTDPTTGLPMPTAGPMEPVDVGAIAIRLNPALTDVRLADVLEAVVKVAEKPIKYSIEEYAVVFSQRGQEAIPLTTRVFKVDPNTFYQGLESVEGYTFGDVETTSGSGGGSGGGRSGGSGGGSSGQGGTSAGSLVPRVNVSGTSSGGGGGGRGGGGGGGGSGGGLKFITRTNSMEEVSAAVRQYFLTMGVDLNPPKSLFWNDRAGKLIVRATEQDLDTIQAAIEVLNEAPMQVNIRTKFAEVYQNDSRALGFDWYVGNWVFGGNGGAVGMQAGSAPSYAAEPSTANPAGTFPGLNTGGTTTTDTGTGTGTGTGTTTATGVNTLIPPSASDSLLTTGLRNSANAPALMTLTGILTDPQFRLVIRALEQREGADLLTAPEVTTLSGRQAQVQVVDIRTIVTGVDNSQTASGGGGTIGGTGGGNGVVGSTINYQTQPLPFGPVLDVLPTVSADGYTIQMTILPTVTEFVGYDDPGAFIPRAQSVAGDAAVPLTAQLPLPNFRVRQVTTTAIVWDGQTIVLGGLMSESVSKYRDKIPVLGDLPYLGRFFRSESDVTKKKNLLIFVTPTIIDPAGNRLHTDEEMPFGPNAMPVPPQAPAAE